MKLTANQRVIVNSSVEELRKQADALDVEIGNLELLKRRLSEQAHILRLTAIELVRLET